MHRHERHPKRMLLPPILYFFMGVGLIVLVVYFWATAERRREHKILTMLHEIPNVTDVDYILYEGKSAGTLRTVNGNEFVFTRIYEESIANPDRLFLSVANSYSIRCRDLSIEYSSFLDLRDIENILPPHRSYANLIDVLKHEKELVNWIEDTIPVQEYNKNTTAKDIPDVPTCIRSYSP